MERQNSTAFGYFMIFRESHSNIAGIHNNSQLIVSEEEWHRTRNFTAKVDFPRTWWKTSLHSQLWLHMNKHKCSEHWAFIYCLRSVGFHGRHKETCANASLGFCSEHSAQGIPHRNYRCQRVRQLSPGFAPISNFGSVMCKWEASSTLSAERFIWPLVFNLSVSVPGKLRPLCPTTLSVPS